MTYIVGELCYKHNVLNIQSYDRGQVVAREQIPLVGTRFRDQRPQVVEAACFDIVKNYAISQGLSSETCRITIKLES